MGGLRCAKEIIDGFGALERQLGCTSTTLLLNAVVIQPSYEDVETFKTLAKPLAEWAAELEKRIREGGDGGIR